jgi:KDO2-lipid IV(A) lauroyltransferase
VGTTRDSALAAGWRFAATVAGRTPPGLARPALESVADSVWLHRGAGVRQLEANLRRAAPRGHVRELSRAAMRSYLRYWGEVFALPHWSPAEVLDRVLPHDDERLRGPLAAGQGVVGVLPHMGNWDLAGAWACLEGMPLTTVAERLRPDAVYDQFVECRTGLGMEVLPLTGGPPTVPVLSERLRAGRFVCLLADRDLSRTGMEVSLLGEPARLPRGPALLALRTGAVLLPITTDYDGDGMHLRMHPPVEPGRGRDGVALATQQVADAFSSAISAAPSDWHLLQRVFTADLDPQ